MRNVDGAAIAADSIELAKMHDIGWQVVVAKNSHKVGDKVVYFEIDSALPIMPQFEFLRAKCYKAITNAENAIIDEFFRIKTIRLLGTLSQGIVIPLSAFDDIISADIDVGTDVTALLQVRHYDEIMSDYDTSTTSQQIGTFPTAYVPKTDEERIQNLVTYFTDPVIRNMTFEVTEKADGSSMTILYSPTIRPEQPFFMCSRNTEVENVPGTHWSVVVDRIVARTKLEQFYTETGNEYAFQGELVGPKINGNRNKYQKLHWLVFRIWDIKKQEFLTPQERYDVCAQLGFEHVPVIEHAQIFAKLPTLDDMLLYVDGNTAQHNPREGFVFKSMDGKITFKCINNNYLLRQK